MTQEKTIDRDFRGWIVTVEQADAIAAGDREAANKFYNDNYERLAGMAKKYEKRMNEIVGQTLYNFEDMMIDLYIDLPLLDWKNAKSLTCDIFHYSFHWSPSGGYTLRKENNLPVYGHVVDADGTRRAVWSAAFVDPNRLAFSLDEKATNIPYCDSETTFGDLLPASREYEADYTPDDYGLSATALVELLSDILAPRELEALKAMLEGHRGKMLGEIMNSSMAVAATSMTQAKRKLILNYKEVLRRLQANGVKIPVYLLDLVPERYTEAVAYSERRRSENNERHKKRVRTKASGYIDKRTPEQRRAEYLRRKERIAREAAQATAAQTAVTSGLA